ncbi:MAG TPA: hypothetical protein VK497_00860 [Candidatus Saccharimonadales bacterium]|nr:hypothetical protein [Candidatus Saccharimonadales bacterium]
MIVILHVIIALASIAHITYTYTRPARKQLYASYGLVGLTLSSGIFLVVASPSHMIEACTVGLVYLGVMTLGIVATNVKLARVKSTNF